MTKCRVDDICASDRKKLTVRAAEERIFVTPDYKSKTPLIGRWRSKAVHIARSNVNSITISFTLIRSSGHMGVVFGHYITYVDTYSNA